VPDGSARAALDLLRTPEGWLMASAAGGRFASLFGRDALISALQVLPVDPSVADATLDRLGRELGTVDDPLTEQEPGKVLHEARDGDLDRYLAHHWPVRDGRLRYYGSVDAGPWFLIVLGALARAGHDVRGHLGAGRRVATWLASSPMPLAYRRRNPSAGLQHQGWRDVGWDLEGNGHGVVGQDGRPLAPPVALAQVQALAWRALTEAALVVDRQFAAAADRARQSFEQHFRDGTGHGATHPASRTAFAVHAGGVDRSATSDLGHLLWTGIVDDRAVADRLLDDDLLTRFGLRTLSSRHPAFRPDGYHTGAVWPFDSWLGAGGLDAVEPGRGQPVRAGVVEAVGRLGGYPELYVVDVGGHSVQSVRAHPEACPVQAWTVGAVIAIEAGWDGRAWIKG
jgi:glycogen debranching enzyme